MFKHILLAIDGSAASDQAVQIAVEMIRTHCARLVVGSAALIPVLVTR